MNYFKKVMRDVQKIRQGKDAPTYREIAGKTSIDPTRVFRMLVRPEGIKLKELIALEESGLLVNPDTYLISREEFLNMKAVMSKYRCAGNEVDEFMSRIESCGINERCRHD